MPRSPQKKVELNTYEFLLETLQPIFIFSKSTDFERTASDKLCLLLALLCRLRNNPSGALCPEHSTIYKTKYNEANDLGFKQKFCMSCPAFEALVTELSPWKSQNKKKNICARMKIGMLSIVLLMVYWARI